MVKLTKGSRATLCTGPDVSELPVTQTNNAYVAGLK